MRRDKGKGWRRRGRKRGRRKKWNREERDLRATGRGGEVEEEERKGEETEAIEGGVEEGK